jgi:hypothetical protein
LCLNLSILAHADHHSLLIHFHFLLGAARKPLVPYIREAEVFII